MKSKILLQFICLLVTIQLSSQSCLPNGLFLSVQSQVDQFATLYPGCKVIEGGLSVTGKDIKNLDGLAQITEIKGDVFLTNCDSIQNVNGLQNVTEIGGAIRVQGLPSLESLNLNKLSKATGDYFYISDNRLVSSLQLNSLDSVYGIFQVWSMDTITDLNELDKLSYVGKDFAIFKNRNLKNLDGLENLINIADGLRLYENNVLDDVSGLSSLLKIEGPLVINDNPSLSVCNTEAICSYIKNPSSFVVISNNANGCSSIPEVEVACLSSTDVFGQNSKLKVYPNPASDYLFLENQNHSDISIRITDITGQLALKMTYHNQPIYVGDLANGMYILDTGLEKLKLMITK